MYLKEKSKSFQKFKWYLARVEKETRKKLKCIRIDRGREFISNEFNEFYIERGIKRQVSALGTPQQNGIAERRNRYIIDCARTLMIENNVVIKYWKEVINTSFFYGFTNACPISPRKGDPLLYFLSLWIPSLGFDSFLGFLTNVFD